MLGTPTNIRLLLSYLCMACQFPEHFNKGTGWDNGVSFLPATIDGLCFGKAVYSQLIF